MQLTERNQTVLVVEDDPSIAEMLYSLLRSRGYSVDLCHDGKEVLPLLTRREYGLLILDVLLPHLSGFALVELIRAEHQWQEMPIILMSGIYRSRNHRTLMRSHGVMEYFDKPLNINRLLELCHETLGAPSTVASAPPAAVQEFEGLATVRIEPQVMESLVDADAAVERQQVEQDARQQFRPSAFVLQGQLKNHPVPALLGKLWHENANGALLVRHEGMKKIFYLRNGSPYGVKSNLVSECLGQVLVQQRLIKPEECAKSIERMKATGKKQGEILVDEMGCITAQNLRYGLEAQMETKLFSTFSWEAGEYRFNPSAPLADTVVTLIWRSPALIVEGIRRSLTESFMRARLLPVLDVPVVLRDPRFDMTPLNFTAKELQGFSGARLPSTCRRLLENVPLPPGDTLRILYSLIALELLVPAAPV